MIYIDTIYENITTEEAAVVLSLPMPESKLKEKLIDGCEYIMTDCSDDFYEDDPYKLNKMLNRINSENPNLTSKVVLNIFEVGNTMGLEEKDVAEKIYSNDFMYEEIEIPKINPTGYAGQSVEGYAAYILFNDYGVPFSIYDTEMAEYKNKHWMYIGWETIWNVYDFMGFKIVKDEKNPNKFCIINLLDSEERV